MSDEGSLTERRSIRVNPPTALQTSANGLRERLGCVPQPGDSVGYGFLVLSSVEFEGAEGSVVPAWPMGLCEVGPNYVAAVAGYPDGKRPATNFSALAPQQPCFAGFWPLVGLGPEVVAREIAEVEVFRDETVVFTGGLVPACGFVGAHERYE